MTLMSPLFDAMTSGFSIEAGESRRRVSARTVHPNCVSTFAANRHTWSCHFIRPPFVRWHPCTISSYSFVWLTTGFADQEDTIAMMTPGSYTQNWEGVGRFVASRRMVESRRLVILSLRWCIDDGSYCRIFKRHSGLAKVDFDIAVNQSNIIPDS